MSDHVVRLGDCLDPVTGLASLPDGHCSHTITDPPYSPHVHFNSVRGKGHRPGGDVVDLGFEHLTDETMRAVAAQIVRITKRWALVFSDLESAHLWKEAFEALGWEHIRSGLWVKICPTPQMTGDRPAIGAEALTIVHPPGRKRWNGGGRSAVWQSTTAYRGGDEMSHSTQKPQALMEALVRDFTDPGELVLDPFSGSGTTGVACKRLGRRFIGWEQNEVWAAAAQKRIDGTHEQLRFEASAETKPRQTKIDWKEEETEIT